MKLAPPFDCDVCGLRPEPPGDAAFDAALRLLTNRLGRLVEIDDGPNRKAGTARGADATTNRTAPAGTATGMRRDRVTAVVRRDGGKDATLKAVRCLDAIVSVRRAAPKSPCVSPNSYRSRTRRSCRSG
jgi:hypothetical protein